MPLSMVDLDGLLAVLCEAPRGQKDLAPFVRGFSDAQRRVSVLSQTYIGSTIVETKTRLMRSRWREMFDGMSLFMHWRGLQGKLHREQLTTTDFHTAMSANHRHTAMRLVLSKRPNFGPS